MDVGDPQARELRKQIERTLARALDPSEVLPMLHRLARVAAEGSDESVFANLHLAEILVERDPWRAALCARRVLAHRDDDRGWAMLALCQTFLGHYRFAVSAYQRALAGAADNPWYAHNLGHLLDVALDRPTEAIGWLKRAHDAATYSSEVAASYGHALARAGRIGEARDVLVHAARLGASRELAALLRWLDLGAPADRDHPLPRPAPVHAIAIRGRDTGFELGAAPAPRKRSARAAAPVVPRRSRALAIPDLETVLARGMASLPLDSKQRSRAKGLARDAARCFSPAASRRPGSRNGSSSAAIAAAVAYAIVYVDHVPLTQAEVAACFRVRVASLRGRFGELRAHLDLTPGDARYATLRRG